MGLLVFTYYLIYSPIPVEGKDIYKELELSPGPVALQATARPSFIDFLLLLCKGLLKPVYTTHKEVSLCQNELNKTQKKLSIK